MASLTPAPSTLGLASPAIGPWFRQGAAAASTLPAPSGDLSVALSLADTMEWRAPAGCTAGYFIASAARPRGIAHLRRADGSASFAVGELVVLLTLLPEVELRLAALSNAIPSPDGKMVPAGQPSRPVVRHLALAVPALAADTMAAIERLRENDFPSDLTTDEARAAFLGLTSSGGTLGNAPNPVAELHRPASDSAVMLKNRTGAPRAVTLWAFDDRGRALDPGAVAAWWSHLAAPGVFDNLWAHDAASDQRTATATAGKAVLFCSAHEGKLAAAYLARLTLSGLTQVAGSLYTVESAPSVALTTAPDPDDFPVPRIALLPNGGYGSPAAMGAGLFNGWTGTSWPATLPRDFARIALVDIEGHLVGLDRTDAAQASARRRVNALRNTAAAPFLATTDAATGSVMTTLSVGPAATAMAPVMDTHWGALTPPILGAGTLPDTLTFAVKALRGEGVAAGGTVGGQKVAVRFADGSLPPGGWVRLWPHGLDTTTGQRFRLDGGAARADASGKAFVVMDLPDGAAAPARLSFDALVVTAADARTFTEQRFDRPALIAGSRVALPAPPGIPSGATAWIGDYALDNTGPYR